jgi:hypothetical protein
MPNSAVSDWVRGDLSATEWGSCVNSTSVRGKEKETYQHLLASSPATLLAVGSEQTIEAAAAGVARPRRRHTPRQ